MFSLWIGRPEFTGWLNHTYYYCVQVRGLLQEGGMHYGDMLFLFYLYALTAKAFVGLSIDPNTGRRLRAPFDRGNAHP